MPSTVTVWLPETNAGAPAVKSGIFVDERELAADHPIKKIYTKRFNTITQYLGRGTLDEQTAAAMKALAKSKLEKALQDSGYAQGGYAAEMEQAALLAEAKETMER